MNEYFYELTKDLDNKEFANILQDTERKEEYMKEKETIVIFTAKKARILLKMGYTLVDIKPDKTDPDGKRSVFVFKNEDGILENI